MLIALIIIAVFVAGGGGMWIISQIAEHIRERQMDAERERVARDRAVETERALRETLVMIAERTSSDRAKAA